MTAKNNTLLQESAIFLQGRLESSEQYKSILESGVNNDSNYLIICK